MEKHDSQMNVCPYCGYNEFAPHNPMYIAPGTILHDRYLIGVLLTYNGEGATYLGYDRVINCKVLIREYMPINLCGRIKDKPTISVNYNNLAKYKAFMAEYTELNQSLARLRGNTNINPTLDMFAENNTTYTVFEYIDGVRLLDFLKDNAGELSWNTVSKIFPPLFTSIGILHNAGITHRAISPETVYINDKGELKLTGFCISAVRTANAGLEYELFKGYAAPEQYSASSRQGSWTDVYSVCALLYRMLTGCMPTDSKERLENDDLCEPYLLNNSIPVHVSRVIMEGMHLSGRDRIQTITELVTKLFEQPAELRSVYSEDNYGADRYNHNTSGVNNGYYEQQENASPQDYDDGYYDDGYYDNNENYDDYQEDYSYEKVNTVDKIKVPIIIGILLFAILMIVAVVFLKMFSGDSEDEDLSLSSVSVTDNVIEGTTEPIAEVTSDDSNGVMLDLNGKYYENIKEKYAEYFTLAAVYEYNDEYEVGQIFEQSIEAGASFRTGDTVTVKVSKGKSVAIIPDYKNLTITQYEAELKKAGITEYTPVVQTSAESGEPNAVLQLQVNGSQVHPGDSFNNTEGKKLIVYYLSKDAVIVTEAPTEALTQAPTEAPTNPPSTQPPTDPPVVDSPDDNNQDDDNTSGDPGYIPDEGEYG